MVELTSTEPQSAADYDDRTSAAVKAVLVEIGQILGSFRGKFVDAWLSALGLRSR